MFSKTMANSVKILSGKFKNQKVMVQDRAFLRPTASWTRACVFDILAHRFFKETMGRPVDQHYRGKTVLDLFCGTGVYALEALSRGADRAILIDRVIDQALVTLLHKLSLQDCVTCQTMVLPQKLFVSCVDLAFVDPPYGFAQKDLMCVLFDLYPCLSKDALVVVETSREDLEHPLFEGQLSRKVRKTWVHFLLKRPEK